MLGLRGDAIYSPIAVQRNQCPCRVFLCERCHASSRKLRDGGNTRYTPMTPSKKYKTLLHTWGVVTHLEIATQQHRLVLVQFGKYSIVSPYAAGMVVPRVCDVIAVNTRRLDNITYLNSYSIIYRTMTFRTKWRFYRLGNASRKVPRRHTLRTT